MDLAGTEFEQLHQLSVNGRVATSIQDLPTELLAIILYHSIRPLESCLMRMEELGTVSSRWQEVVKGTPKLWSRVTCGDHLRLVKRAMHESKDTPLDIEFHFLMIVDDAEPEEHLSVLCDHMNRWKHASVDVSQVSEDRFRALAAPIAPRLETLKLHLRRPILGLKFQAAMVPLLRELDIAGIPLEWETDELRNLHVFKLTTTKKSKPSLSELMTLLQSLPKLEEFKFYGDLRPQEKHGNPSPRSHHPVTLPHLKRLVVQTNNSTKVIDISSCLRAPACQDITLGSDLIGDGVSPTLGRAVGHFIPIIRSNWVPGERLTVLADDKSTRLLTSNIKLTIAGNTDTCDWSRPVTIPRWLMDNVPNKESEIALDVRLSSYSAERLVSLVSLGPILYLTRLDLSGAEDGGSSVIQYVSRPASAVDEPDQWPLPRLSSIVVRCYDGCLASLLSMLQARAGGVGDADVPRPVSLKTLEIKAYSGNQAGGEGLKLELESLMQGMGGSLVLFG
ncbi:hypothetical protein FRC00_000986 [Tulasnella sp. 408]|nr:hypothetical protein FRC00_000986 [Tulasnella sp. 408]